MSYNYFKKITRLYFQEKEGQSIRPISETDSLIFIEIMTAIDKTGKMNQFLLLLQQWKQVDDEELLRSITEYNLRSPDESSDDEYEDSEKSGRKHDYVEIMDGVYRVVEIASLEKSDIWDFDKNKRIYTIVINQCDGQKVHFMNKEISFDSQSIRDEYYNQLRSRLQSNSKIKFI